MGLLVLNGSNIETVAQWNARDPVIEGPWPDPANDRIWAERDDDFSLLYFDGANWHHLSLPPAHYTRLSMLSRFSFAGGPGGLWFMAANKVWKWNPKRNDFDEDRNPPWPNDSRQIAFADGKTFAVMGDEQIIERSSHGDQALSTPGPCEALTSTSSGKLLASFRGHGIYEYDGTWKLRFASPPRNGAYEAFLSEQNGKVAYARSPRGSGDDANHPPTRAKLWLSSVDQLLEVSLPHRPRSIP